MSDTKGGSPIKREKSPVEGSPKSERGASRSRSGSRHRSYSRSRSRSKSGSYRRSRSRSRGGKRNSRSRSGSRSNHRRSSHRRSSYRSRSRSYSPRGGGGNSRHSGGYGGGYGRRGGGYYRSRSRSPMSERRRHQGNRENPEESSCVGVFGLSLYTQERDLRDVFDRFGPIEEVQIVYDRKTGRSRGFAFIYYQHTADSVDAKERMAGYELDGHRLRVDYSITRRAHTPTPGIYLGKPTRTGGRRHRSTSPSSRSRHHSRSRSRSYDRY